MQARSVDRVINILVLGDQGVGKSYLVEQFIKHPTIALTEPSVQPTFGVAFHHSKRLNKRVSLQCWDTSGDVKFKSIVEANIKDKDVYILVFDITNKESFKQIPIYFEQIQNIIRDPNIVLVANKCELVEQYQVSEDEIKKLENDIGAKCIKASAALDLHVDEVFEAAMALCPLATPSPAAHQIKQKSESFFHVMVWKY